MRDKRFTIRVPGDFHSRVSARATANGLTITQVILGLLLAWLDGRAQPDKLL